MAELSELLTIVLGVGVGLSLGALGGGGSTLAVPILVFVAGMSVQDATSASLLVVGVASAIGAIGHYREGNVRLGAGLAFGAAGVVGSKIGTVINRTLPEDVLLAAFAVLVVAVAVKMYQTADEVCDEVCGDERLEPTAGSGQAENTVRVSGTSRTSIDLSLSGLARLGVAASGVGLLTGLFGVGGGFAVVPALTLLLGFGMRQAIGTSLVVITVNTAIALGLRSGSLDFDWALVGPFLATVTVGVVLGSRLASRVDAERLTRAFAVMLVLVGAYTGFSAVL